MDKLTTYQKLLKDTLTALAALINRQPVPGVTAECALDDERGQYLLLTVGWSRNKRVRGTTVYVRLRDGKIWIEEDWTEEGITSGLLKSGVPKEDIVLGFQPPQMRPLTEFAVA
ncbi:MAG: xisI [Phycisphaerales bacterium]|nr:xisI [Phycisphaerales bacterium]